MKPQEPAGCRVASFLHLALRMMDSLLKMMDFVLKSLYFVLKLMDFVLKRRRSRSQCCRRLIYRFWFLVLVFLRSVPFRRRSLSRQATVLLQSFERDLSSAGMYIRSRQHLHTYLHPLSSAFRSSLISRTPIPTELCSGRRCINQHCHCKP